METCSLGLSDETKPVDTLPSRGIRLMLWRQSGRGHARRRTVLLRAERPCAAVRECLLLHRLYAHGPTLGGANRSVTSDVHVQHVRAPGNTGGLGLAELLGVLSLATDLRTWPTWWRCSTVWGAWTRR